MISIPSPWTSDFHVHTNLSYDAGADCTPEAIARTAAGLGMREIGLTDHLQVCSAGAPGFSGPTTADTDHRQMARHIRETTLPVRLLVSWEVDYFDGGAYSFDPARHLAGLDYVLLGHHYMRHMASASPGEMARYLHRIHMEMAAEPYADIVAHPYYLAPAERHGAVLREISDTEFESFFSVLREHGKAAEITAYQFSAAHRDVQQNRRMYRIARRTGVKFVLDSDSHALSDIGEGLRCISVLQELGFQESDFVDYDGLMRMRDSRKGRNGGE